ncbi:NUDIX domain-containing protein [Patescibacteria group bacterium]|nr:NUDIX domain-containing protein [Patescibacteria group bacterium]
MGKEVIKPRVRLVIIKKGKILLSYVKDRNFYFYTGGKVEYGETLEEACVREVKEECNAKFTFKKILYIRDYIVPDIGEHSLELYILGDIDKFKEVEGLKDPEDGGNHWQTWVDLKKLKAIDVRPRGLVEKLLDDYKKGFKGGIGYIGEVD